jgi:hypothetical protein
MVAESASAAEFVRSKPVVSSEDKAVPVAANSGGPQGAAAGPVAPSSGGPQGAAAGPVAPSSGGPQGAAAGPVAPSSGGPHGGDFDRVLVGIHAISAHAARGAQQAVDGEHLKRPSLEPARSKLSMQPSKQQKKLPLDPSSEAGLLAKADHTVVDVEPADPGKGAPDRGQGHRPTVIPGARVAMPPGGEESAGQIASGMTSLYYRRSYAASAAEPLSLPNQVAASRDARRRSPSGAAPQLPALHAPRGFAGHESSSGSSAAAPFALALGTGLAVLVGLVVLSIPGVLQVLSGRRGVWRPRLIPSALERPG